MFAIWGIGVDLPRLLVRYGKSYSQVIDIHSISMVIMGLLTILYVLTNTITFYSKAPDKNKSLVQLSEMVLSFILSFFVIVQFILGYASRAEMVKTSLSTSLFSIKMAHKIIGNAMSLVGKVVVIL